MFLRSISGATPLPLRLTCSLSNSVFSSGILQVKAMGAGNNNAAVFGDRKLSTVVPRSVTGDNVIHELTDTDLLMKQHYIRSVYYFKQNEIVDRLNIEELKDPMFMWLNYYFPVAGRIRLTEAGRPVIKCNDSGVRIIEAQCSKTLEEWHEVDHQERWRHLVSDKVLGPDLYFSPLVYIQVTKFQCGGLAIGYSWSHVLGDAQSAANCINMWGQLLSGKQPHKSFHLQNVQTLKDRQTEAQEPAIPQPISFKQVESVGDCWQIISTCKMATDSFHLSESKLKCLQSDKPRKVSDFETISAVFWYCLAKVRIGKEPKLISICRNEPSGKRSGALGNEQKIGRVTSDVSPAKVEFSELAILISKCKVDESKLVEDISVGDIGDQDFLVYGTNLTFVDMKGVDLQLELMGQKPTHIDYSIDGIGNEGTVLVFQGPQLTDDSRTKEATVVLILPEDQILKLREVLKIEFDIT